MRARIHRGAREIGGNCVELESHGRRLVLDLGRPLSASAGDQVALPPVPGLDGSDKRLLGVIVSHPHADHCGLLPLLAPHVPVYMGAGAQRVLNEAAFFTDQEPSPSLAGELRHRHRFELGPFRITPYLVDHGAFDCFAILVEADGKALFYSGDVRAHGRRAWLVEELLARPPDRIDALVLEGTRVGRTEPSSGVGANVTEADVEDSLLATIQRTRGAVLAVYSPQNIDRMVTLYRAAVRAGRDFVMDLYAASIAAATGRATVPQSSWDRVRVYVPYQQRRRVIDARAFDRTDAVRGERIYPEDLAVRANELVLTFRTSMIREFVAADGLGGATCVWCLWPGYLAQPSGLALRSWLAANDIPLEVHHSSGHASIGDLQRLVSALNPGRVVPIHTEAPERFAELFPRAVCQLDGAWWEV